MPTPAQTRRTFLKTSTLSVPMIVAANAVHAQAEKPVVLGGKPTRTEGFPDWPIIEDTDRKRWIDSLERKAWCRLYDNVTTTFEQQWAEANGAKHAIGVVNGTNAIYAALNAVGVEPGDEVLVPPYTFMATVNAVFQNYALPVFVDSDKESFQFDAKKLESYINPNTKCILPVQFGGNMVDMDNLMTTAKKHNLSVVEDACQSHFAEWMGKKAGAIGDVGCFSHQSTKILPCGEGGSVITSSEDLYDKLHAFQNNGRDRTRGTRNGIEHQGTNLRMTEYQAALLIAQLERLEDQCKTREANANYLTSILNEIPGIKPAIMYKGCTRNTYYLYMLRIVPEEFKGLSRAKFINAIRKEGIPIGGGYKPLNKEPFIKTMLDSRGFKKIYSEQRLKDYWDQNHCPENDILCEQGMFMGQEPLLGSKSDMEQIAEAIKKVYEYADEIQKV